MNARWATWLILGLFYLGSSPFWAAHSTLAAEAASLQLKNVAVGIGDAHKVGHWTPIRLELAAPADAPQAGRLVLTTSDVDGLSTRYADPQELTLTIAGDVVVWRYVKFGHASGRVQVEFVNSDGTHQRLAVPTPAVAPTSLVSTSEWLVAVGNTVGIDEALLLRSRNSNRSTKLTQLKSLAELPDHPAGYEAMNTLVLATSEIDWSEAPPAQLQALQDWVLLGGRVLLSSGKQGATLFGPEGVLTKLAPGPFDRVTGQRRSAALEAFVGANQRLDNGASPRFSYDMTLFKSLDVGRVEVSETGPGGEPQPLIINYPVGLGQVTLLTCDLDQEPLRAWRGRPRLVARLLAFHEAGETGRAMEENVSVPSQLGFHDLAGQLRTALDQYAQVMLIAFSWVAALVVLYVLLLGPGDYYFGKFVARRMQITWLTLPLITLSVVALAWWISTTFKSSEVRVNQASVVDIDLQSGAVRGNGWTHVYSPETAAYEFTPAIKHPALLDTTTTASPGELQSQGAVIAWQGLPGVGLGGLDGRPAPNLFDSPYQVNLAGLAAPEAAPGVLGMPITSSATKSLRTQWWQSLSAQPAQLQATRDGLISGEFTYNVQVELEDCLLLYENWLYRIPGKLAPGEKIRIADLSSPRNLQWQLTKKRTVDSKDVITPWDVRSQETNRILEVMLFHKAAGGNGYTGLTNSYYLGLDLSDHLRTGRAILFGKSATRALELQNAGVSLADAYDQSVTYYRVVLPLVPASAATPSP